MNNSLESPASPDAEKLNTSCEIIDPNESVTNLAEKTVVNFEETLPPGAAPEGFLLVDEDRVPSETPPSRKRRHIDEPDGERTQPIIKVTFRNANDFINYCHKIEKFLKELVQPKRGKINIKSSAENLDLEVFESRSSCTNIPKTKSDDNGKEKQSNNTLFTVDTERNLRDELDVPMYGKKFNKTLETVNDQIGVKGDFAPKMTCFNCLGNHSLRDCEVPRNPVAISKNRKDYNARKGSSNARYHVDDEQRFGHFIPGQISPNLRKALGIRDNELPRHIYRMRILGYPPGWLEEARLQHSGLALFDSEGLAEQGSDEEGEVVVPGDKDKYDIKKIIDFPGYNTLPPHGTREEVEDYWGSSLQEQNSKSSMLSYLSCKQVEDGYKRRKLPNPANVKPRTDINPGEMDIDEVEETPVECVPVKDLFIPPLPKEDSLNTPPPPPPEDDEIQSQEDVSMNSNDDSTTSSSGGASPSLVDLENAKKKLLAELDDSTSHSNPESAKTDVLESESSKTEETDTNNSDVNNSTPKSDSRTVHPMLASTRKSIISVHVGTPILQSCSPFRRLPAPEKFSKDICDVINFENLPDSTGKYDQMVDLLQKVRTTVSRLQKE